MKRVILIVLDSVGAGAMPDAAQYGDEGAHTLGHVFEAMGPGFYLRNLAKLGLYNAVPSPHHAAPPELVGSYGTMACVSPAKDTTAGHWELAGVTIEKPFPLYPGGFPPEIIEAFEKRTGTKVIGNVAASGTEIIRELGEEHCRTGFPIVYTSADSVFQIAAHEGTFGLARLYDSCRMAREMLTGPWGVCRVIARPFTGLPGAFYRTENRKDFALPPPRPTLLDRIKDAGGSVIAIGKIDDIFSGRGITRALTAHNNTTGMITTIDVVANALYALPGVPTLIFTNLVDFDMLWGHRRDVKAYAQGLKEFDDFLPSLTGKMRDDDVLIITADHGCDPTFTRHTDHTREYVPLLVYGKSIAAGVNLGLRSTFSDVAQTIAALCEIPLWDQGNSFKNEVME